MNTHFLWMSLVGLYSLGSEVTCAPTTAADSTLKKDDTGHTEKKSASPDEVPDLPFHSLTPDQQNKSLTKLVDEAKETFEGLTIPGYDADEFLEGVIDFIEQAPYTDFSAKGDAIGEQKKPDVDPVLVDADPIPIAVDPISVFSEGGLNRNLEMPAYPFVPPITEELIPLHIPKPFYSYRENDLQYPHDSYIFNLIN